MQSTLFWPHKSPSTAWKPANSYSIKQLKELGKYFLGQYHFPYNRNMFFNIKGINAVEHDYKRSVGMLW